MEYLNTEQQPSSSTRIQSLLYSRDEMNLAEFPLTVLSTRANTQIKTLEFRDTIRGKNGEAINREWIISGADKFGLPTSSDDEILLGLLKLTVDEGIKDRKIYFTRYELLKNLKWTTEGRNYSRLQKALDRLSGVRIKATNAFYDNDAKLYSTKNFGIIDAYEIFSKGDKPSYFIWSEVLFKSFQVGFIKKLDLDFYLTLQSAVAKRLYRYLDKHFWYKRIVTIPLFTLCFEKIGISRNYAYASSLIQQLNSAIAELKASGFLEAVNYEGKGKGTTVTFIAARPAGKHISEFRKTAYTERNKVVPGLCNKITSRNNCWGVVNNHQEQKHHWMQELSILLIERGINDVQSIKLLERKEERDYQKLIEIIHHYDMLLAKKSRLISRNPQGFLYSAIKNHTTFVVTGESNSKISRENSYIRSSQASLFATKAAESGEDIPRLKTRREKDTQNTSSLSHSILELQSLYLIERKKLLNGIFENTDKYILNRLFQEVEQALAKLKPLISSERFKEAVQHGVEEKLAKINNVLDFQQWSLTQPKAAQSKKI
jgi:hypothetical protein